MQGVYAITNTITGEQYVGQSAHVNRRWWQHEQLLLRGLHHSSKLAQAWAQYGPTAFAWSLLEAVPKVADLRTAEQRHITQLQPAYNGQGMRLRKIRKCQRQLMIERDRAAAEQGAIYIIEAMLRYNHARDWFTARIKAGILTPVTVPGTTKVYLRAKEIEEILQA